MQGEGEGDSEIKEERHSREDSDDDLLDVDLEETKNTRYVCKICNKFYVGLRSFLSHARKPPHGEKTCIECSEKFAYASLLEAHCASFNHALRYKCDFCDEEFNDKIDRSQHVKTDHKVSRKPWVQSVQYNCPLCQKTFGSDKYGCWSHLRAAHREESVGCEAESCRYACVGKQLMFLHTLSVHTFKDNSQSTHYQRLQGPDSIENVLLLEALRRKCSTL